MTVHPGTTTQAAGGVRHGWLARAFFGEAPLAAADSLRLEPERWSIDLAKANRLGWYSRITRDDGIEIWVGNRAYGMAVERGGQKWGGVGAASSIGVSPGHYLLRIAADRWLRRYAAPITPTGGLLQALRGAQADTTEPQVSPGMNPQPQPSGEAE